MQNYTFNYKGLAITIQIDRATKSYWLALDNGTGAIIGYTINLVEVDLANERAVVHYKKGAYNNILELLQPVELYHFDATTQENFTYFFDPTRSGEQLLKMCFNGLLTSLLGVPADHTQQVMCFGQDGIFYPPIWFEMAFTPEPQLQTGLDPEQYEPQTFTLTATVLDGQGPFTYKLLGSDLPAQSSPTFTGLPSGTYTVLVTSTPSMPCIRTASI